MYKLGSPGDEETFLKGSTFLEEGSRTLNDGAEKECTFSEVVGKNMIYLGGY